MAQKAFAQVNSIFHGAVVQGNQIGRKIGFPTANLNLNSDVQFPTLNGVYSVFVYYNGKTYEGVMNIGVKPTFENTMRVKTFEVHILNFSQDIYGEQLQVEIHRFIRSERKFESVEALKKQLAIDCEVAKKQLRQDMQVEKINKDYMEGFKRDIDLEVVHAADLDFVRFCENKFGINRGVYNVIDKWFADNQIANIVWRRTIILRFLYWVGVYIPKEKKIVFGMKGLKEQLTFYYTNFVVKT